LVVVTMVVIPNIVMAEGHWTSFAFYGGYYNYSHRGYYGYYGVNSIGNDIAAVIDAGTRRKLAKNDVEGMEIEISQLQEESALLRQELQADKALEKKGEEKRRISQDLLKKAISELKEKSKKAYHVYLKQKFNGQSPEEAFRKAMEVLERENQNCYDQILEHLLEEKLH